MPGLLSRGRVRTVVPCTVACSCRFSGAHVNKLSPGPPRSDARRKQEMTVFLVLTLLLAPVLTITTIGGYGLSVWVYQMIAGPPGAPAKAARTPGFVPKTKAE